MSDSKKETSRSQTKQQESESTNPPSPDTKRIVLQFKTVPNPMELTEDQMRVFSELSRAMWGPKPGTED